MTAGSTRGFLLRIGVLSGLLAGGCASDPEPRPESSSMSVAARKRAMLMSTDLAIQKLLGRAEVEINKVQNDFQSQIDALATPVRLNIVHPVLEEFGQRELDEFRELVRGHEATATAHLEEILERYEAAMWTVAIEAGKREHGSDIGYRTGYGDLDAKVLASLAQLRRRTGLDGIAQVTAFRLSDRITLIRKIRHEIEGVGLVSLLISPPENVNDLVGQEGAADGRSVFEGVAQATAFSVQKGHAAIPLRVRQAVRYRIVRGGIVVQETPWRWDPSTPDHAGVVELYEFPESDGSAVLTLPLFPRLNVRHPDFVKLYNTTVVAEYRTALQRTEGDEFLTTLGWQITWGVDYRGQTRVLVEESMESVLEDDPVIADLLRTPPDLEGPDQIWLEAEDATVIGSPAPR